MTSDDVHARINELVEEQHRLRDQLAAGLLDREAVQEQLRATEVELDQCWDLVRQRDAKRHQGADPDEADVRPSGVVESYDQ